VRAEQEVEYIEFGTADARVDGRLDLMAALARISPGQRAVLVLRYWEQLDVAETAEALDCSPGTVKSQTSAAMTALRRLLPEYVPERRTDG
jgi:RNA polymerase sigma factor (sigma-70 family)